MKASQRGSISRYAPLLLCIVLIMFLSGSEASMENSSRILFPLLKLLFPAEDDVVLRYYVFFLRKFAHLVEYALLAFLAARAFLASSRTFLREWRHGAAMILVGVVSAADEITQSFNPSRSGTFSDVLLDLAGGAIGIVMYITLAIIYSYFFSPTHSSIIPESNSEGATRNRFGIM